MNSKEEPAIKKSPFDEKPFLNAINKAFAECFISVYGDIPFSLGGGYDAKWENVTLKVIEGKRRPNLTSDQVNEILLIAARLRDELTIRFKLMYILMVSRLIMSGKDNVTESKVPFYMLSMRGVRRSFIEQWKMEKYILTCKDSDKLKINACATRILKDQELPFIIYRFAAFMEMTADQDAAYLDQNINKNEEGHLYLAMALGLEELEPFENVWKMYEKQMIYLFEKTKNLMVEIEMQKYIHDRLIKAGAEFKKDHKNKE